MLPMRPMNSDKSPSRSGHRTKCQWFGNQQNAQIRMVATRRVSSLHAFEGGVVRVMVENLHPAHAAIEDMEYHASRRDSSGSRHAAILSSLSSRVNICACPF